jgi:hypothetical protein
MRVFGGNKGLSLVCSASLALGPWGLASARAPSTAPAAPRVPDRNENGIQVRPASRPENSLPPCAMTRRPRLRSWGAFPAID